MTQNHDVRALGSHLDHDACTDLLQGYMSLEEQDAAFDHLRHCPACEEDVRRCSGELERLRSAELPARKPARAYDTKWIPIAAAAAVTVVAVAALLVARRPESTLSVGWLPAATNLTIVRGGVADTNLIAGLAAYDRRDLETAVALLSVPQTGGPPSPYERLRCVYLGTVLAATGDYSRAIEVIGSIPYLASVPEPWGQEVRWAYYVSLRNSGRRQSADSLLRVFAAVPGALGDRARGPR